MRNPVEGAQFRREVKLAQERGKDRAKLREVFLLPIEGTPLPPRNNDHPLGDDWKHFRDCHIGDHFGDSLLNTPARSPRALQRERHQRFQPTACDAWRTRMDPFPMAEPARSFVGASAPVNTCDNGARPRMQVTNFDRITVNPNQMGGVPCIRGIRIPVATVLRMLAGGMTEPEILADYPDLQIEDIRECLRFAAVSAMERELPLPRIA